LLNVKDAQRVGWFSVAPYEDEDPALIAGDYVTRTPSDHMGIIVDISK
jgi:hypothetical protein